MSHNRIKARVTSETVPPAMSGEWLPMWAGRQVQGPVACSLNQDLGDYCWGWRVRTHDMGDVWTQESHARESRSWGEADRRPWPCPEVPGQVPGVLLVEILTVAREGLV